MATLSQRIADTDFNSVYERAQDFAEKVADQSRNTDKTIQKKLPAGSERYLPYAGAGLAIGLIGSYQMGRMRSRRKIARRLESRLSEGSNFSPMFKLAKLWGRSPHHSLIGVEQCRSFKSN